jgi:hypothetical protein
MNDEPIRIAEALGGKRKTIVVEVDRAELVCRIIEASSGHARPEGLSASEAVDLLAARDPEPLAGLFDTADVAIRYVIECLAKGVLEQ